MKRINKVTILYFFLIGAISCKNQVDDNANNYVLQKIRTDSLLLDSITTPDKNALDFLVRDGKINYLYMINRLTNTLYKYNWATKKQIQSVKLPKEGPNGIGDITYIYVKSIDSIFAMNSYSYSLILLNSKCDVIRKYRLLEKDSQFDTKSMTPPTGRYSILPKSGWESPIFSHNNYLYIAGFPNLNPYEEGFFSKSILSMRLNLLNGNIKYFGKYPAHYKAQKYFPLQSLIYFWAYNFEENKLVYSFPDDNFIYMYNLDSDAVTSVEAKSEYFDKAKPMSVKKTHNPEKDLIHYMSSGHFERIVFDKYNNIYYRFVKINKYDNFTIDKAYPFYYKIIVLDRNFKKIAEINNQDPYEHGYYCVTKEGLYLQETRANNEDYMYFTLFKLAKK